jgi:DNA-binding MarR family transcriptional regulator
LNEFIILGELSQAEGKLRRIDLAERIGLTASGVTRLLLPMEKIGLVRREANKDDARSSLVVLASGGKRKLEEALTRAEEFCEDNLPEDDNLQELSKYLKRVGGLNLVMDNKDKYAKEAQERWGESDLYKQSQERVKNFTKADWERIKDEGEKLMKEIVAAMSKGPEAPEVQKLIAKHYDGLRAFYEPNLTMYRGLGDMYYNDPRFSAYYEKFHKGLAKFMMEAINVYCDNR